MTTPLHPALFDKWEAEGLATMQWRVQLVGYIGQFPTEAAADRYIAAIKDYRKKFGGSK